MTFGEALDTIIQLPCKIRPTTEVDDNGNPVVYYTNGELYSRYCDTSGYCAIRIVRNIPAYWINWQWDIV